MADLSRVIAERGVQDDAAHDAALTVAAVEFFDRDIAFNDVFRQLQKWQLSEGDALSATFEGARIVRESNVASARSDDANAEAIFALNMMGIASLAAAVLMAVVGG
jgi:hypothetical protein